MALTKEDVFSALRTCRDPEIPVNIVDLGLVYGVEVRESSPAGAGYDVSVKMTLTSPGCPMSRSISAEVQRKLLGLERVHPRESGPRLGAGLAPFDDHRRRASPP